MKYFEKFVSIPYTFDQNLVNFFNVKNIFIRVRMLESIINNVDVYYNYMMKESDTVESIAYKYYGDVDKFWLVMFTNKLLDPFYDTPLKYGQFLDYLISKYKLEGDTSDQQALDRVATTLDHYEKIMTTTATASNGYNSTQTTTTYYANTTYSIDGYTTTSTPYHLPELNDPPLVIDSTSTLIGGVNVNTVTTLNAVSIYDTEYANNEKKRNIKLIKKEYAEQVESELRTLLSKAI